MYRCISKSCACTLSSKTLVLPSSITSCARFGRWQHARIIPTLHRTHPDVGALGAPNIAGKAASDRKLLGGQGRVLGDVHTEEEALGNASAPVGGPAPRHAGPLLGSIGLDRCKGSNKDSPPPPSPVAPRGPPRGPWPLAQCPVPSALSRCYAAPAARCSSSSDLGTAAQSINSPSLLIVPVY
jgi:hypothetical protein